METKHFDSQTAGCPTPFILALLLTLLTFIIGIAFSPENDYGTNGAMEAFNAAGRMLNHWNAGFWNLLQFGMQMALILVLGGALARSRAVSRLIDSIARIPRSNASAAALVAFSACFAALLNWGLGLIVGALLARRVAAVGHKRNIKLHYPLLGAAGYTGLMVWHGGLSGSGPLAMNTPGSALVTAIGQGQMLPLEQTIFSPLNLIVSLVMLALVPLICAMLAPRETVGGAPEIEEAPASVLKAEFDPLVDHEKIDTPAARIETSRWPVLLFGLVGLGVVAWQLFTTGFSLSFLNLNSVNWILLFAGLALHESARSYVAAVTDIAKSVGGIVLQFPFYAGIMGMIVGSGLVTSIATAITSFANEITYPIFTFFAAAVVNLFVPSGGGQVAVQGPIVFEVSKLLGGDFSLGFMALCYGDQWTNMLQPFWALPLLGLTGLRARDLLGYTIVIMLLSGIAFVGLLLLFSIF